MSGGGHTPGPWFAVNVGSDEMPMMDVKAERIRGQGPTHCVAICATGDSPQEMENANADLIAAAPELLGALEEVMKFKRGDPPYRFTGHDDAERENAYWDGWRVVEDKILAAIKKARGDG